MPGITPFLWFDNQAEEAMNFYCSIFKNSKAGRIARLPNGTAMRVTFELDGQPFHALNGGPTFHFTAISMFVDGQSQDEVDHYWCKLTEGGQPSQCGWLKDKFGLSWQIVPRALTEMLSDPDPAKSQRTMQAMLKMSKINIQEVKRAYAGN